MEQWKSLLQTYLKSFDFDAADKTVKKILEASPLDAYANELYPKISDWKDYDIKDGILYKYSGKAKRTEVPYGVITIEGGAFADCVVEEVVLPDTVGKLCGDVIGAFRGCKKLGIINLPESVKYVGEAAFEGTSLVKVCIPQSVEVIGAKAFAFCSSLAEITIPESVKHIGVAAFSYCTALSSVRMESLVCRISDSRFAGCTMLTHFEIPASIQEIGALAFSQSGLQEIEIPSGVTFVGGGAFGECKSLESVTIVSSAIEFQKHSYVACNGNPSVCYPGTKSVLSGGEWYDCYAFRNCTMLRAINHPETYSTEFFVGTLYWNKLRERKMINNLQSGLCPVCGCKIARFTKDCTKSEGCIYNRNKEYYRNLIERQK